MELVDHLVMTSRQVPTWNGERPLVAVSRPGGKRPKAAVKRAHAAGALGSLVRVEKRLGRSFFQSVRTDPLHVLLPQLLRSLGYPREVLPGFLLPSPGRQHLGVTQWGLRSMSC